MRKLIEALLEIQQKNVHMSKSKVLSRRVVIVNGCLIWSLSIAYGEYYY